MSCLDFSPYLYTIATMTSDRMCDCVRSTIPLLSFHRATARKFYRDLEIETEMWSDWWCVNSYSIVSSSRRSVGTTR